jgi:hypothetical protein
MSYTITLSEEQKNIVAHALRKFSELTLGQRTAERALAAKMETAISNMGKYNTTVDLSV